MYDVLSPGKKKLKRLPSLKFRRKKRTWPISSHLDLTLGQKPILIDLQCVNPIRTSDFQKLNIFFGECTACYMNVKRKQGK